MLSSNVELTKNILEWLELLDRRPKMIISEPNISSHTLKNYLDGYLDGIGHAYDQDLQKMITLWYGKMNGKEPAVSWSFYILRYYDKEPDEKVISILLETLTLFFKENPNWYKSA